MKPISRRKASDIYHDGKKSVVDTIVSLSRENVRLKEKLLLNSTNSSKPPSSDAANVKPKKEKNKPGRPHGHIGKTRDLLPFEKVDKVIDLLPESCKRCGDKLVGNDNDPARHQFFEIPKPKKHMLLNSVYIHLNATVVAKTPPVFPMRLRAVSLVL